MAISDSTSSSSSKSSGASTASSSSSASSANASTSKESTTVSKPETESRVAEPAASSVGSATELSSGRSTASDPAGSRSFAGVQSEAATEIAGKSAPEDEKAAEYRELQERIQEISETPVESFGLGISPEMMELQDAQVRAERIVLEAQGDYGSALSEVEDAVDVLSETVAMVDQAELEAVPFMETEQAAEFREYAAEVVARDLPAVEEASGRLVEELNDPVFQETLRDLPPSEQMDVIEGMARNLGLTEVGRERLGTFVDGLTGTGEDALAEVALDLRGSLTGEDLTNLDRNLGLIVGIDGQARPDGADARAESVLAELGVVAGESDFATGRAVGNDSFSFAAGVALDAVQRAVGPAPTGALGMIGRVAGGASAALDALGAVEALQEGDLLGAATAAAGVAEFVSKVAPQVVPRLLSKAALPLTVVSTAVDVWNVVADQSRYADFLREGLDRSMGDDPIRAGIWRASSTSINLAGMDRSQPMRPQLEAHLAEIMGPDWRNLDPYDIESEFWTRSMHNAQMRAQFNMGE